MIETQVDARRLSSIDAATALGRLADAVVLAVARRASGDALSAGDERALHSASEWLDRLSEQLAKPLDLSHIGTTSHLPGVYGFGPDVNAVAIDAISHARDANAEIETLRSLRDATSSVIASGVDPKIMDMVAEVFESVARAMLSAADSLLNSPSRRAWPTSYSS